jgi:hypothetical protein
MDGRGRTMQEQLSRTPGTTGLHPPPRVSAGSTKKPPYLNDVKAFVSWMVPKADVHGRTNAAGDRMSRAAGLNK